MKLDSINVIPPNVPSSRGNVLNVATANDQSLVADKTAEKAEKTKLDIYA